MMLSMFLFWVALIGGLVALIRWLSNRSSAERPGGTDALEIARTRYAKGEISRDEFERLREDLTHASHAA
jgi:putative membrane protein